jgi:Kelch motif
VLFLLFEVLFVYSISDTFFISSRQSSLSLYFIPVTLIYHILPLNLPSFVCFFVYFLTLSRYSAVTAEQGMYIFGGYDKGKDKYFSDLTFFDFASKEWFNTPVGVAGGEKGPTPRLNHSCVWDSFTQSMIIIGGKGMRERVKE